MGRRRRGRQFAVKTKGVPGGAHVCSLWDVFVLPWAGRGEKMSRRWGENEKIVKTRDRSKEIAGRVEGRMREHAEIL